MQPQTRNRRGEGSIYAPPRSSFLWIKYYREGKAFRESTRTADPARAARFLRERLADAGQFPSRSIRQLYEDLERDYRINGRRSLADLEARWRLHLEPFFGSIESTQLNSTLLRQYIDQRLEQNATNSTINRELACLRRMYRLAGSSSSGQAPRFPRLEENNVRQGFITAAQYAKLVENCRDQWLRALLETGYTYGWRISELLNLRAHQVDLTDRTIRLEPGTTKNREGREVTIESEMLFDLLRQCIHGKATEDYVFTRASKPIRDFRATWKNLRNEAGLPGLLFHDLRRTAARNLRAAGVPEEIIMRIAGWKTAGVFKRYAIVNRSDIRDALSRLEKERPASLQINPE